MNLKYSILWFDDTADFYDSIDKSPLEEIIYDWGFEAEFKFVTEPDEFMAHEPFNEFDLIVVDYNLEAHELHGSTFIKKIRDHQVFTEVVFYSSNPASDLWNDIRDHFLEGVFVANRRNVLEKIQQVAEHSVQKILDIENMRGILMAEVGDIDKVLDEILLLAFPSLTAEQAKSIFDRFHEGCQAQDASRIEKLRAFLEKPLAEEMISLSDSSKRWDNFNRLRKALPHLKGVDFGNYHEEVLAPRNFLAHGIPTKNENGGLIFSFHTKQYEFNSDVGKILRKTINQYKKKLIETHKIITTNQDNN